MNTSLFRKLSSPKMMVYLSFGLLVIITGYCAWYANYYLSGNSDDIIYPYFFSHFHLHDVILPSQHSNLLKFPLFTLQAALPYTFTTFTIVNIALVLATIVVWAAMLVWLLGRKYTPHICLTLVSVLLGSQLFNYDILGTTIRNIEYPIVLGFVIATASLLHKRPLTNRLRATGGIVGVLYAFTLAGDTFFLYTVVLSLFVLLAGLWFKRNDRQREDYGAAAGYALGFTLLGFVIRKAVTVLGVAHLYTADVFLPHVLPLNHLAPSISTATTQVLDLFDANIFGQRITLGNGLVFLNFLLLVIGLAGLLYLLKDVADATSRKHLFKDLGQTQSFTLGVLALSCFIIYVMYIVSDQVVVQAASGSITSAYQDRYLSLLPLITVAGVVYMIRRHFSSRQLVAVGVPVVIVVVLLASLPGIKRAHVYSGQLRSGPTQVARIARSDHIPLLLTGYWYGASTRFWSQNHVQFASVASCNYPEPTFNNRFSWYKPSGTLHSSALVIVHTGQDSIFWECPDSKLRSIYGTPARIIHVNSADKPEIWLYNYDLRTKLAPMTF